MRPPGHASVDSLFDVLDDLVDDRTGIIRGVSEIPNQSGAPDFFHYAAEACNSLAFAEQRNFSESGGVSTDRRIAMAKAVGEAVERYCSALYVREELPLTSSVKAPFRTVDPSKFALFNAEQYSQPGFRCVPFTRDTTLRWTEAMELATQCNYYVPACMVYVPYHFEKAVGDQPVTFPISTGLACHSSWTKAAITAICEIIERDAFTITWQSMLTAPPIRLESLSDSNRDLIERFMRTGASIRVLNLTLDHETPCILSILSYDRTNAPALVVAASASTHPEDAVRKSLEELAHTHRAAVQLKSRCAPFVPKPDYSNVINQEKHIHFYTEHAHRSMADFLFSSQEWT